MEFSQQPVQHPINFGNFSMEYQEMSFVANEPTSRSFGQDRTKKSHNQTFPGGKGKHLDLSKPTKVIGVLGIQSKKSLLNKRTIRETTEDVENSEAVQPKKLSSEEILLQELEKKRQLKAKLKQKMQKFYQQKVANVEASFSDSKVLPQPPTQFREFKLKTEERIKSLKVSNPEEGLLSPTQTKERKEKFTNRDSMRLMGSGKKTEAQPFNLTHVAKVQNRGSYVPLKQRVDKFFKEETFSCRRGSAKKPLQSGKSSPKSVSQFVGASLTRPLDFKLRTMLRNQSIDTEKKVLSTEELELQKIKEHGQFKARQLNKKLFTQVLGLPQVEKMPCTTEFNEFKLRLNEKKSFESLPKSSIDQELEECTKQFKARELNKKILEQKPLERKSAPPVVQFNEFKLKSEQRGEEYRKKLAQKLEQESSNKVTFHAREMPKFPTPKKVVDNESSISSRNVEFKEFKLATEQTAHSVMFKERMSAPPTTSSAGFQALKMPDFSKLHQSSKLYTYIYSRAQSHFIKKINEDAVSFTYSYQIIVLIILVFQPKQPSLSQEQLLLLARSTVSIQMRRRPSDPIIHPAGLVAAVGPVAAVAPFTFGLVPAGEARDSRVDVADTIPPLPVAVDFVVEPHVDTAADFELGGPLAVEILLHYGQQAIEFGLRRHIYNFMEHTWDRRNQRLSNIFQTRGLFLAGVSDTIEDLEMIKNPTQIWFPQWLKECAAQIA